MVCSAGRDVKNQLESDVVIIGAGMVGASIARELSQYKVQVTVVEKSADTFTGQTKSGHGFVYSGRSLNMALSLVLKSVMSSGAHLWEPGHKNTAGHGGYDLFEPLAKRLGIVSAGKADHSKRRRIEGLKQLLR
jgi:glycerol-3-phosphate dehydrogenase